MGNHEREKGTATPRRLQGKMDGDQCLDSSQLQHLEEAFRKWATESARRPDRHLSRRRILLIFLLIRHTGAKLNEVLTVNPSRDIDYVHHTISLGHNGREVQIATVLAREIKALLADEGCGEPLTSLKVDPGFVRRKFYERAAACGFARRQGSPEMIRRARGAELLGRNMPLPAVQMLLGHASPNLTTSYASFSDDELRQTTRFFLEKDPARKTSARNHFFGKIRALRVEEVMTAVEMVTPGGSVITTLITNNSRERLGLVPGGMISAEVKATGVLIMKQEQPPQVSAENLFRGEVSEISRGTIMSECVARIADGSELCAVISSKGAKQCDLQEGDPVWVLFSSLSVILKLG